MKILICICTYHRNKSLLECLRYFNQIQIPFNINIKFLINDNSINFESFYLIKNFKKKFKYTIYHVNEKKRGIVYARNRCLKISKKINCDYIAFFDDDCVVDKNWFKNVLKIINTVKVDIITGPQIYRINTKKNSSLRELFEKKNKKNIVKVSWAATNNVIFKKNIVLKENIFFDKKLNYFGMGEDQLFFSKLNKLGYKIIWSKNVKVYEKIHLHRNSSKWIKSRSYRLGILGHYIDQDLNGKFLGFIINYIKFFYYFFCSILFFLIIFKKNNYYKFLNFIFRALGRLVGPFIFRKIKFYNK